MEYYETAHLGGQGEVYSRLLALRLLTRATLESRRFKLAIELTEADKFDDVAFYDEAGDEWWLMQAKHSIEPKEVTWEAMFPKGEPLRGDFSLVKYFKSYVLIRQRWRYLARRTRLFLFTNRCLHSSVTRTRAAEVDEMLQFAGGVHVHVVPELDEMRRIQCYFSEINNDFHTICRTIAELFTETGDDQFAIVEKYKTFISQVLIKHDGVIRFHESFSDSHSIRQVAKLYSTLKTLLQNCDFSTLSVCAPARFPDIWSDSSTQNALLPALVDEDTVKSFFSDLILSFSQPNGKQLEEIIQSDWIRWMKSRVRPEVFRKLTDDQLHGPFNTFKRCFDDWEDPYGKRQRRRFLAFEEGAEYLEIARDKLEMYGGMIGLEKYNVGRRIAFIPEGQRIFSLRGLKPEKVMKNEEFVGWLCKDSGDQKCFVMFADLGMGKRTLWQQLAFSVQKSYLDVEVFLIDLNEMDGALPDINNFEDAIRVIRSFISEANAALLRNGHHEVVIFLSNFDELEFSNKQKILKVVGCLTKNNPNIKTLITTRELFQAKQFQTRLHARVITIMPLENDDQCAFLRLYWSVQDEDLPKFNTFSSHLLQPFQRILPQTDFASIGLPLTMKLIAEIVSDTYQQYQRSKLDFATALSNAARPISFLKELIFFSQNVPTLLHVVAQFNACEAMQVLLQMPLSIDIPNGMDMSPLSVACEHGHLDMVKLLVARGANVNHRLGEELTPLSTAAFRGHLPIVDYLTRNAVACAKVNPDVPMFRSSALIRAILRGNLDVVQLLVVRGASVDAGNYMQDTALHMAAHAGNTAVMGFLLDHTTDIERWNLHRQTPLQVAAARGFSEIVKLLIERSAKPG